MSKYDEIFKCNVVCPKCGTHIVNTLDFFFEKEHCMMCEIESWSEVTDEQYQKIKEKYYEEVY